MSFAIIFYILRICFSCWSCNYFFSAANWLVSFSSWIACSCFNFSMFSPFYWINRFSSSFWNLTIPSRSLILFKKFYFYEKKVWRYTRISSMAMRSVYLIFFLDSSTFYFSELISSFNSSFYFWSSLYIFSNSSFRLAT